MGISSAQLQQILSEVRNIRVTPKIEVPTPSVTNNNMLNFTDNGADLIGIQMGKVLTKAIEDALTTPPSPNTLRKSAAALKAYSGLLPGLVEPLKQSFLNPDPQTVHKLGGTLDGLLNPLKQSFLNPKPETIQKLGGTVNGILDPFKSSLLQPSDETIRQLGKNTSKFLPEAFGPLMPAMRMGLFKLSLAGTAALSLPLALNGLLIQPYRDRLAHNKMMLRVAAEASARNRMIAYGGLGTIGAILAGGIVFSAGQATKSFGRVLSERNKGAVDKSLEKVRANQKIKVANALADSQIRAEAGKIAALLKGAIETIDPKKVADIRFDDVIGQTTAKEKFIGILNRMANEAIYRPHLSDKEDLVVPTILTGPPGVGKTHLVRGLIGELNASRVDAGLIQLHCDKLGFQDTGARALGALKEQIEKAKEKFVVVFMDEMDSLGNRSSGSATANNTINSLLTLMDGVTKTDKEIIWIGASNHPDRLDPAILSRFPEQIPFILPTQPELLQIYKNGFEQRKLFPSESIDEQKCLTASNGFSGRDANGVLAILKERLMNRLTGKQAQLTFTEQDFLEAIQSMNVKVATLQKASSPALKVNNAVVSIPTVSQAIAV